MTIYLNPETMTKEEFLDKHGVEVDVDAVREYDLDDHSEECVVCIVDNGAFRAAGIMGGDRDFKDFTSPTDLRPKKFFAVKTEDINKEGGPDRLVS